MKIIFKDKYAKLNGLKAMEFTNDCKVGRNKNDVLDIDTVEIVRGEEILLSFDNKIIQEIILD